MIKANVISGNSNWKTNIKKPNLYLKKRLKILSKPTFRNKNHEFSILLANNKLMKHLNYKFRKKIKPQMFCLFHLKLKVKIKYI